QTSERRTKTPGAVTSERAPVHAVGPYARADEHAGHYAYEPGSTRRYCLGLYRTKAAADSGPGPLKLVVETDRACDRRVCRRRPGRRDIGRSLGVGSQP